MSGTGLPLEGLRVVVTRPRDQAQELANELEAAGAVPIVFPLIRIEAAADPEPLHRAAARAGSYDWIVFTSANGVLRFWEALEAAGGRAEDLVGVRFACVGPATRRVLEEHGVKAEAMPSRYLGAEVAESLTRAHCAAHAGACSERPLDGVRILLPLAAGAAEVLERDLRERGAAVERVEAYRSVPDAEGAAGLRRFLAGDDVDVVTFTSPSAVDAFVDEVGVDLGNVLVAVIGPVTAAAARRRGLRVGVEAREYTVQGFVKALVQHVRSERDAGAGV